jgi:hypothetical protein
MSQSKHRFKGILGLIAIAVLSVALVSCGSSSSSKSTSAPKTERKAWFGGSDRHYCFNTSEPSMRLFFEINTLPNGSGPHVVTSTGSAVCALALKKNDTVKSFGTYVRTADEYFVAYIQMGAPGNVLVVPKNQRSNDADWAYKEEHKFSEGDEYTFSQYMEDGYTVSVKRLKDTSTEEYLVSIGRR